MREWMSIVFLPKWARQAGYVYKASTLDLSVILVSILSRFIYMRIQYQRAYLPCLVISAVSTTFTAYFSAFLLEIVNAKYIGASFSETGSTIWFIQATSGLSLLLLCYICSGQVKLAVRFFIRVVEMVILIRYLRQYRLLSIGMSIFSGSIYLLISLIYIL